MPIVGSFAGASSRAYGLQAGLAIGDFESIASTTVGSGGAADVTFSSIPQNYTHLQIRCLARFTAAITFDTIRFQFNGDTATNYSGHWLSGSGSAASSGASTNSSLIQASSVPGASSTASVFGVEIIDILDYANTNKYKTTRNIGGYDANGSGLVELFSGNWRSTSAISSIKLYPNSGNFAQYSSFSLYGIKG